MQKTLLFYVLIFMLATCTVSALLPYPIFSSYTNITEQNAYEINNYQETELENDFSTTPKILELEFDDINLLLPDKFEIIDIETEEVLNATRIGGNNHADITLDKNSQSIFHEICNNWNWSRRPVLVKINETAYLPASIICYPHGYNNHFCLHFKNSKTHGTDRLDTESQKAVERALKKGKSLILNNQISCVIHNMKCIMHTYYTIYSSTLKNKTSNSITQFNPKSPTKPIHIINPKHLLQTQILINKPYRHLKNK